ncbi:MAG: DNA recombination protein RmuC [Gammaproteobacteria bacterium]|nr:DNA recombination protein RmuC [Gammaproteobacteria bacterium]MDH3508280.1 DNA recombination protein RmuC [Gammaproteobacteria bacterium]
MLIVLEGEWQLPAILAGAGFLAGLLIGWGLTYIGRIKLKHALAIKETELKAQARQDTEREQAFSLATERLSGVFSQLANQHLSSHSETFLKLAKESLGSHHERAKGELAAREQAVEALVRPIREALLRTESQINALEKSRQSAYGTIKEQLEAMAAGQRTLSTETRNLVNALRRPEVRGQWGEITLRRLVELAGMVEHCDFVTQVHQQTERGSIRPDLIIHMPDDRQVVVDVKTPLDAYLDATQTDNEEERSKALARHALKVSERIRELASKAYWAQFEKSPDFVILFIPGDQFLSAALAEKPNLLDDALRQQIILATPTSLVALLKAIAYGWQQLEVSENATEIRKLAVQLYERLTTFASHMGTVGKELGSSVQAFNKAVGSLERMVMPAARRFTELGVNPKQPLPTMKAVEDSPRDISSEVTDDEPEAAEGPADQIGQGG